MKANTLHKQYKPNLLKYVQIGKYTQKIYEEELYHHATTFIVMAM